MRKMIVYILILGIILIISIFGSKVMNKLDVVFFLILSLISGFRYAVGTDFFGYISYFETIKQGDTPPAEVGFILISKILISLNLNSQSVFLIFSIFTMFFIYQGLKYFNANVSTIKPVMYIIMMVFTIFPSFNGVRQALAAAIVFYACKYINENNFKRFLLWILLAMSFHFSSIIFIGLYFIVKRNYKSLNLILILIFSFLFAQLGLINKFLEFLLNNLEFIDIGGYIENYLYSSYNLRDLSFGIVFYINMIILVIFTIYKERINNNDKNNLIFNFFYLYILFGILSMDASMLSRMTYFFSIFMAIYIPKFVILFNKESSKIVVLVLVILYSFFYLYIIYNGLLNPMQSDYIPYNYNFDILE